MRILLLFVVLCILGACVGDTGSFWHGPGGYVWNGNAASSWRMDTCREWSTPVGDGDWTFTRANLVSAFGNKQFTNVFHAMLLANVHNGEVRIVSVDYEQRVLVNQTLPLTVSPSNGIAVDPSMSEWSDYLVACGASSARTAKCMLMLKYTGRVLGEVELPGPQFSMFQQGAFVYVLAGDSFHELEINGGSLRVNRAQKITEDPQRWSTVMLASGGDPQSLWGFATYLNNTSSSWSGMLFDANTATQQWTTPLQSEHAWAFSGEGPILRILIGNDECQTLLSVPRADLIWRTCIQGVTTIVGTEIGDETFFFTATEAYATKLGFNSNQIAWKEPKDEELDAPWPMVSAMQQLSSPGGLYMPLNGGIVERDHRSGAAIRQYNVPDALALWVGRTNIAVASRDGTLHTFCYAFDK